MRCVIAVMTLLLSALMMRAGQPVDVVNKTFFTWGAECGTGIDMSANDMSSVDFNASFGLRRNWLSFAGVGAGANVMVSGSYRSYPVFAVLRTDFSRLTRLLFMDVRGGVSINYLDNNQSQTGAYASAALGVNLATGRTFRSYILAGYAYYARKDIVIEEVVLPYEPLHTAFIRLGVAF